jgi:hypothetical protein
MGLRGSIGVIFIIGAGRSIADSSTIRRRFLLNGTDVIRANILIDYIAGTTDQFSAVFKGVGYIEG